MRYTTGTISINIGSSTLTGTGTSWLARVPQNKGWVFLIAGESGFYDILEVVSDTSIALGKPYAGPSNKINSPYILASDYTYYFDLPVTNSGNVRWAGILLEMLNKVSAALYENKGNKPVHCVQFNERSNSPTVANGVMYYDDNKRFYVYNNGGWRQIQIS